MKKFVLIVTCILLVALCFTACKTTFSSEYDEEMLSNGTFEGKATSGWTFISEGNEEASGSSFKSPSGDYQEIVGKYYVEIDTGTYAGYTQTVSVEKNKIYRLSANVLINSAISSDAGELAGAYVAIDSDYALVNAVQQSKTSGWKTLETYFNSGDRTFVTVTFGVGREDYEASGTAGFDGISLMKVKTAPEGVIVTDLPGDETDVSFNALYRTNKEGRIFMILAAVLGAACLFALYAAFRTLMGRKGAFLSPDMADQKLSFFKSPAFIVMLVELLAFAVRLILINFVYGGSTLGGYVTDATKLADLGASSYYFDEKVLTPIGSLYVLWVMGLLASPLKLVMGSMGFSIFIKIPAVLADLVIVFLVYYLANRKYNQYISALFAGAYAIFPLFFFLSAGWGAYASIGALFILLSLTAILDKKYIASIIYYAVALLFMTEALLLAPLFLAYLAYVFIKSDDYKMGISITLTSSIIVLYLLSIPFILSHFTSGHPFIVVKRYCQAFLAHTGFTENAFSIYALFGLGAKKANVASYVFNGIFVGAAVIMTVLAFFKSRSRLDLLLLSAFTFVFTFVMTSAVDTLLIYPALLLLLVYGMITEDRRVLKLFGGLSLTTLLNTSYAMTIGGYFGTGENSALVLMTAADPVMIIFSIVNVLLLAYFSYILYSIIMKDEVKGVVIVEGNYFLHVWSVMKKCAKAVVVFFTQTVPSLFKKKQAAEDTDARQGQ